MSDGGAYKAAGVDIDAQDRALDGIREAVRSTFTAGVLNDLGSFGGLFRPELAGMEEPVLVASADGVGTKLMVARLAGDFSTVGADLVNHCVDDILVQGAEPLFFLDYVGSGRLETEAMAQLVGGVARACRENGCALLGGETAEMPGFYQPGDYELVGFVVGLVDRPRILPGERVEAGDVILGLPSAGLHTNGYSLARRVFFDWMERMVEDEVPELPGSPTVAEVLLAPHLSYLPAIRPLLGRDALHALAHITGGGLTDNVPRVLPAGHRAVIDRGAWPLPPLFSLIQREGRVELEEMYQVFNMGIGMTVIVAPESAEAIQAELASGGAACYRLGEIERAGAEEPSVRYVGDPDA